MKYLYKGNNIKFEIIFQNGAYIPLVCTILSLDQLHLKARCAIYGNYTTELYNNAGSKCGIGLLWKKTYQAKSSKKSIENGPDNECLPYERQNTIHWRHNDHDGVSNHQPRRCLLNHLFRRRSKKTSKLRVTGLCEFPARWIPRTKDQLRGNVSIWWRHHDELQNRWEIATNIFENTFQLISNLSSCLLILEQWNTNHKIKCDAIGNEVSHILASCIVT